MDSQPSKSSQPGFPEGYIAIIDKNGDRHVVPDFLVLATHQVWDAYRKQAEMNVKKAEGGVCPLYFLPTSAIWISPMPSVPCRRCRVFHVADAEDTFRRC